jgi:hypothetical protein
MQTYSKNDSNNFKTWWSILLYIEYDLIALFKLQLKSLTHVILQKNIWTSFLFKWP